MIRLLISLICAILMFVAWTYIYSGELGLFIVPDNPETEADNFVRFLQAVCGLVVFVIVFVNFKFIKRACEIGGN